MEKQKHGFIFENYIINKYNLKKEKSYTGEFDAYSLQCEKHIPVSIKTCKKGSAICLGDYFRQRDITEDFFLVIGFWEDKTTKKVVKTNIHYIESAKWKELTTYSNRKQIETLFEGISNSKEDNSKWRNKLKKFKKDIKEEATTKLTINPKRDSKKQKRIQCSLSYKKYLTFSSQWGTKNLKSTIGENISEEKGNNKIEREQTHIR